MLVKYKNWIDEIVDIHGGNVDNRCYGLSKKMKQEFPELRLARGFVYATPRGEIPHWWLVAKDGLIVDPTLIQFKGQPIEYVEFDENIHGPEPLGKCLYCGELTFPQSPSHNICSESCNKALMASFNFR